MNFPRQNNRAAEIALRIMGDDQFAIQCLQHLHGQQTELEQNIAQTIDTNGVGFTSSDAKAMSHLMEVVSSKQGLTPGEMILLKDKLWKYGNQLAKSLPEME